jgi:NitT/TauT family transport system ATP-binding protein
MLACFRQAKEKSAPVIPVRPEIVCRAMPRRNERSGLFPWMTLLTNVEFPLKIAKVPAVERRRRALGWIERVGLGGFEHKFPRQLSGGMEKRGSLARALVADKPILLMDEPFGPLDAHPG